MRIEVRLFGALADRAGTGRVTVEVADDATAGDVVAAVGERHPVIATYAARVSVAVDHEVVREDRPLSEGAEVALLPPVAGGATRAPVTPARTPQSDGEASAAQCSGSSRRAS